jgi:hypothetical protein
MFLTHNHQVPGLQSVIEREKAFMSKVPDNQYLAVKRVMEWVDRSIKGLERAKLKIINVAKSCTKFKNDWRYAKNN